jgi:hypothetical protein
MVACNPVEVPIAATASFLSSARVPGIEARNRSVFVISTKILYGVVGISISAFGPGAFGTVFDQTADYVYVETNLNPANSIRVFSRGVNGQLQEIAGSPFATGGAGSGYNGVAVCPDDSDQEIITNPDHSLLFAINAGSDSIAVFNIGSNGALTPVAGSPFPSGGNDPVSLASADCGRPPAAADRRRDLSAWLTRSQAPTPSYWPSRLDHKWSLSHRRGRR